MLKSLLSSCPRGRVGYSPRSAGSELGNAQDLKGMLLRIVPTRIFTAKLVTYSPGFLGTGGGSVCLSLPPQREQKVQTILARLSGFEPH